VGNPYPLACLLLGSYYNEVGRSPDALRVLDHGLALPTAVPGSVLGQTRPNLVSERGAALTVLKRWPDALAAYTAGLQLPGINDAVRGLLLRGRGFALTELGRLDEAESAYRESLAVAPNSTVALKELAYLARLRAGARPTGPELITPQPR
jgi:tetratricopeptide (TPR) repeat protein